MTKRNVGRPPRDERACHCCMVRFADTEFARFLTLYEQSGVPSKAVFIKARVFNESFRMIKVDRTMLDYYQKRSSLFAQFRAIGVNYNQLVVALRSNFTKQKAMTLLYKLEKLTIELAVIGGEIVERTNDFREREAKIEILYLKLNCVLVASIWIKVARQKVKM